MYTDEQADPDVLSVVHSKHINKVRKGGYIYISDVTSLQAASSKDCDLVSGKASDLYLLYYSFALRNNSAYGSVIGKM